MDSFLFSHSVLIERALRPHMAHSREWKRGVYFRGVELVQQVTSDEKRLSIGILHFLRQHFLENADYYGFRT
ncbi:unnamed protein product [Protopolystoma xenopodis]|uniref:Uncharacterized protein n=1 Tax=Protopolystoma xenopodis TaxID=117903 RepID=A0A3S5AQC3_9PLAT|nr:unnamed protein product [Protopolystoma xenopodis]